jgi:hypothetical protein
MRGRTATDADQQAGNAVFVAQVGAAVVGQPIDIVIPQYAFHVDVTTGARTPVIVLQAERAQGLDIVGYRIIATGEQVIGTLQELELLGPKAPPRQDLPAR